jgi:hypothetical protein
MKIDPTYGRRVTSIAGAQLERLAPGVDVVRLEGLRHAQVAATAQADALRQDRARLVAKYGADAPQVALTDARLAAQAGVLTRLRVDIERAETPRPEIGGNAASIYGRVVDDNGAGLSGYTVSARDAHGAVRGRAVSGDYGAFQIMFGAEVVGRAAPRPRRKTNEAAAPAGGGGASALPAVTLEVTKGKDVVARREEPVDVLPGTAAYVELGVEGTGRNAGPTSVKR